MKTFPSMEQEKVSPSTVCTMTSSPTSMRWLPLQVELPLLTMTNSFRSLVGMAYLKMTPITIPAIEYIYVHMYKWITPVTIPAIQYTVCTHAHVQVDHTSHYSCNRIYVHMYMWITPVTIPAIQYMYTCTCGSHQSLFLQYNNYMYVHVHVDPTRAFLHTVYMYM